MNRSKDMLITICIRTKGTQGKNTISSQKWATIVRIYLRLCFTYVQTPYLEKNEKIISEGKYFPTNNCLPYKGCQKFPKNDIIRNVKHAFIHYYKSGV
jgi:hypothetical protein